MLVETPWARRSGAVVFQDDSDTKIVAEKNPAARTPVTRKPRGTIPGNRPARQRTVRFPCRTAMFSKLAKNAAEAIDAPAVFLLASELHLQKLTISTCVALPSVQELSA